MANNGAIAKFLLTPLREGRQKYLGNNKKYIHFYSRPCGRGDYIRLESHELDGTFLLTPLREGRLSSSSKVLKICSFLLTPLREGRRTQIVYTVSDGDFYSRPCGRGDRSP